MVEQRAGRKESDVLTIESRGAQLSATAIDRNVVTLDRPETRIIRRSSKELYSERANRIVVRHHLGRIVAVIEIVSPDNKDGRAALRDFVETIIDLLRSGIHVLVIDLFPPTPRDPFGMHKAIWDEIEEEEFVFPPGKDRILVSYQSSDARTAYVEPVGVGEPLPGMPLFVASELHVKVPLDETYQATWGASPEELRVAVETGKTPDPDAE